MDDFSVSGVSFELCLENHQTGPGVCEETNLVLNWEKWHFIVKEGIVLSQNVSKQGLDVDQARVEVTDIFPPPFSVKWV